MAHTDDWNAAFEALPTDDNYGYEIDNYLRLVWQAIRERMEIDHYWKDASSQAEDGKHKKITLPVLASAPTKIASTGIVYVKDVSGKAELFYIDEDGDEVQLTTGGKIGVSDGSITVAKIANAAVTQAKLKTGMSSVSGSGAWENLVLPGGQYGFYPQVKHTTTNTVDANVCIRSEGSVTGWTTYRTNIAMFGGTTYAQQRYVTSSGEVFWIFILRNKLTKEIKAMYQAPDHPCFGNGGKPLLVPHPFGNFDPETQEVIVINPSEKEVVEMKEKTIKGEDEPDKDLLEVIVEDYEINELSNPPWPKIPVTVGLPAGRDWKREPDGVPVIPIKKVIPKPDFVITKSLRKKNAKAV